MTDPFKPFEDSCLEALKQALSSMGASGVEVGLEPPPDPKFGDLAYPCFEAAKQLERNPFDVAVELEGLVEQRIKQRSPSIVAGVEAARPGYLNFKADVAELASSLFKAIQASPELYGRLPADRRLRVIVEHTSGNPVHPLTAGTGRNAFLGDALARLLEARGHVVKRHFYVDDVGFQVALAAYAYSLIKGRFEAKGKPDHFVGLLYALANAFMELQRLKGEAEGEGEEAVEARSKLSEWAATLQELRERDEKLFDVFLEAAQGLNLREEALKLNRAYERGDPAALKQVRELCELALQGFKQTLARAGVKIDSWDWESEVAVWSGGAERLIEALKSTPFTSVEGGALVFDAEEAATALNLKLKLGVRGDYTIPSLTLTRADGTTLYTTRDIAYALWKLHQADLVISVIGSEQRLAQLQLKIALHAMGRGGDADRYLHYAYELVRLPGQRMSGRRGRYVTLDQLIDEAAARLYVEVEKRWPTLPVDVKREVAERLGVGAVRFALLSVSASKPMTFSWDQVVNFERNSFPFINYAYVRALGILRKGGYMPSPVDASKLTEGIERELVLKLSLFPRTVKQAADELRPELLTAYLNELSQLFNSYYEKVDVIHVRDAELRKARLELTHAVKVVVGNGLNLLGIQPVEVM
jgi:arginyl-tRNA synthetase